MRIMGLDYGSKTVGVAISDPLLMTAQGIEIIRRESEKRLRRTLARIEELVKEYEVEKIVSVVFRRHLNNSVGERGEKSLELKEVIERRCGLEVIMWDERFTTVEDKQNTDRSSMYAGRTGKTMLTCLLLYSFYRVILIQSEVENCLISS